MYANVYDSINKEMPTQLYEITWREYKDIRVREML